MVYSIEANPVALFDKWYGRPLRELEQLPDGDGGFVVLAVCCFLYERYACGFLQASGQLADDDGVVARLAADFSIEPQAAKAFWDVIRNGLLHQGMPKARNRGRTDLPRWRTHHSFPQPITLGTVGTSQELRVQPWRLRDRVLELYRARPDLIGYNDNFPWGEIVKEKVE